MHARESLAANIVIGSWIDSVKYREALFKIRLSPDIDKRLPLSRMEFVNLAPSDTTPRILSIAFCRILIKHFAKNTRKSGSHDFE